MCMTYNYVIMLVKLLQTIIHTEIISTVDNRAGHCMTVKNNNNKYIRCKVLVVRAWSCAAISNPSVSKVKSPLVSYYMLVNSYTFLSCDLTK